MRHSKLNFPQKDFRALFGSIRLLVVDCVSGLLCNLLSDPTRHRLCPEVPLGSATFFSDAYSATGHIIKVFFSSLSFYVSPFRKFCFALLPVQPTATSPVFAVSPLNVEEFSQELAGHPNHQQVAFVLHCLWHGLKAGFLSFHNLGRWFYG